MSDIKALMAVTPALADLLPMDASRGPPRRGKSLRPI